MNKKFKVLIGVGITLTLLIVVAFSPSSIEPHVTSKKLDASKAQAWAVISDVGNYHQYATGLSSVTIVSGSGEGMIRSCSDEQGTWQETCTAWEEGTSYSFEVDTGSGFPYPFKKFNGTWTVNQVDQVSSILLIEFEYQFPYRWMSWFFNEDTHNAIEAGNQTLTDNWERKILEVQSTITLNED